MSSCHNCRQIMWSIWEQWCLDGHLSHSEIVWSPLTHWGQVMHICVSKLTIIGSDNGLSPDRRQAIIWTNAGILLIRPLGTNFNEILIEIPKMRLKVSSAKRRPFCLGLNVLIAVHPNISAIWDAYIFELRYYDVIKWKNFPRYWPFVRGIHRSPVNSPHKGQWCGVLMFSLFCAWINDWVNNVEAGDLRRHHTHYDVIVIKVPISTN